MSRGSLNSTNSSCIIRPGRSLRERSLWVAHATISNESTCALSHFLRLVNSKKRSDLQLIFVITHFLLVEGVWLHLSLVAKTQYCAILVSRRLVLGYSLLPPPAPPTPSRMRARGRQWGANVLWSSCVMRPVNSCRICTAVMNVISGFPRYNRSRYDSIRYTEYWFWYDTDPIIIRSLNIQSVSQLTFSLVSIFWLNFNFLRHDVALLCWKCR